MSKRIPPTPFNQTFCGSRHKLRPAQILPE
jgi:hypothetical protein